MNLHEVLDTLGVPHKKAGEHHHVRGVFTGIDCYLCSPGTGGFKLGVTPSGIATCWTCGRVRLADALSAATGIPWHKIKPLLDGLPRWDLPEIKKRGILKIPSGVGKMGRLHRAYLKRRGIDPDEAESVWGVQGIGMHSNLSWRLFVPIHDPKGEVVNWTTRTIGKGLRYLSASPEEGAVPRNELLYGEHLTKHAIIVVEGPLDALRVGPGAVATMGVKWSQQQLLRISRYPLRCICFDSEVPAQMQAKRLCNSLSVMPGETRLIEIDAKDPGECSDAEVRELRKLLR
jgi:hypothetical protein